MTSLDAIKGTFYVDLIAEWKAGTSQPPKESGKSQPKGRRAQRSRRTKRGKLDRLPVAVLAA